MGDTTIVNVGAEKTDAFWVTMSWYAFALDIKILTAVAFWMINRRLIDFATDIVQKSLER